MTSGPETCETHVFALTGGIGSGKSSVAAIFREEGVPVVDADQVAREAVVKGSAALTKIVAYFGEGLLNEDGSLNRAMLADRVFSSSEQRAVLDGIVHPQVRKGVKEAIRHLSNQGYTRICYDIPLLFETRQEDSYRPVVVVGCSEEQQLERASARDGISREAALARLRAQLPLKEKLKRADIVVTNEGTKVELRERAIEALKEVRQKW